MKVYLIGTNHRFQTEDGRAPLEDIDAFRLLIRASVSHRSIAAIAEEMCLETVHRFGQAESVPKQEAVRLGLPHRYCDPDTAAREAAGIVAEDDLHLAVFFERLQQQDLETEIRRSWAMREAIWVQELQTLNVWPVLFICGARHTLSFNDLLTKSGMAAEIIAEDWSP